MDIGVLQQKAMQFAEQKLPGMMRAETMKRLDWHKQQGHRCVVISASLELYVQSWALKAGFDDVIATHLETLADGRITGNLSGNNCFGIEKVSGLRRCLAQRAATPYTLTVTAGRQGAAGRRRSCLLPGTAGSMNTLSTGTGNSSSKQPMLWLAMLAAALMLLARLGWR